MLPDSDGLDICKGIRSHPELAHIPVIFLTARASETDRIVGLETRSERLHREAVLHPRVDRADQDSVPWSDRQRLASQGRRAGTRSQQLPGPSSRPALSLTATEFRLLEFLMSRPGVVFSREQLLDAVWGHDRAVTDRTVDVYILRLRQKTETDPANPSLIRSVRGFGYSFNEAEITEANEQGNGTALAAS